MWCWTDPAAAVRSGSGGSTAQRRSGAVEPAVAVRAVRLDVLGSCGCCGAPWPYGRVVVCCTLWLASCHGRNSNLQQRWEPWLRAPAACLALPPVAPAVHPVHLPHTGRRCVCWCRGRDLSAAESAGCRAWFFMTYSFMGVFLPARVSACGAGILGGRDAARGASSRVLRVSCLTLSHFPLLPPFSSSPSVPAASGREGLHAPQEEGRLQGLHH